MWKIIYFAIKKFRIQLVVSFWIVKIDDVSYKEFNNLSIYDSIRDKLFESNNMWNIILTE